MAQNFDVIVIGGGIAGLTAGRDVARLGHSTLVLTGLTLGGQLISIENVENWPPQPEGIPGFDLCPIAQEEGSEARVIFEMVEADAISQEVDGWLVKTASEDFHARAVILAMGATLNKLGIPGEDRFEGRGVSQCASCDAPLLRNMNVVVVGGGDSALQETLALLGPAAKITIVTTAADLTAQPHFQAQVRASSKVAILTGCTVTEIIGENAVTGVSLSNGEKLECAAIFPFIGMTPASSLAAGLVELDATGALTVDTSMRTRAKGLLAAGTIRAGAAFRAAGSAEDGTAAAQAAHAYLREGNWPA